MDNSLVHSSELALQHYNFDYIITNNGSIEELTEKVQEMLKHFKLL
jgi:dephospho-CoA kinase